MQTVKWFESLYSCCVIKVLIEAQMAAFEKARASRAANVKAKKDAKELEIEVLTKDKQARMAAKELKKKDRSSDQLRQAEAKIMKLKKKIAKSKLPAEPKKKYYSSESESDEEEVVVVKKKKEKKKVTIKEDVAPEPAPVAAPAQPSFAQMYGNMF